MRYAGMTCGTPGPAYRGGRTIGTTGAGMTAGTEAVRAVRRMRGRAPARRVRPAGPRHPLVAVAMAAPLALLLAVACGGWHAVVLQASSVAGAMGR